MSRSVPVINPLSKIREAVRLMKAFDVDALLVCNESTLVGTLCDREIALANTLPSDVVHSVITPDPAFCFEDDLLIDAQELMRVRRLNALPVRESNGRLSGIVRRRVGS
ncbi:MAG: CBS domain-containing protein [Nitrospiraceae bacterium]